MATCGNCGKRDASVAEIRACYEAKTMASVTGSREATVRYERREADGSLSVLGEASYARPVEIEEDRFYVLDGTIYLVIRSESSGHLYAKTPRPSGGFGYAPGAIRSLVGNAAVKLLSVEEAAEFGKTHGFCAVCARKLTNTDPGCSVERGYGPKCAENMGWPWGVSA